MMEKSNQDIRVMFDGKTSEDLQTQVDNFIQSCIDQSDFKVMSDSSMVLNHYAQWVDGCLLSCGKCGHITKRQDHMRQHLAKHFPDLCYKCKFCGFTSGSQSHFKIHLRKHTGIPSHHCSHCTYGTFTLSSLKRHIKYVHDAATKYRCPACSEIFGSSHKMIAHSKSCKNITHQTSNGEMMCDAADDCRQSFSKQTDLLRHLQLVHRCDGIQCSSCPYVAANVKASEDHKRLHKTYACAECDFRSTMKKSFLRHFAEDHSPTSRRCNCCDEKLSSREELDAHESKHLSSVEKSGVTVNCYKCLRCDYTTPHRSINLLKKHVRRIHGKEKSFSCTHCSYSCIERAQLTLHMRKHEQSRRYLCQECGFTCKWPSQMNRHSAVHKGEKAYKCSECSYASHRSDTLAVHARKHCQTRSTLCDVCGFSARTGEALSRHMLVRHRVELSACQTEASLDNTSATVSESPVLSPNLAQDPRTDGSSASHDKNRPNLEDCTAKSISPASSSPCSSIVASHDVDEDSAANDETSSMIPDEEDEAIVEDDDNIPLSNSIKSAEGADACSLSESTARSCDVLDIAENGRERIPCVMCPYMARTGSSLHVHMKDKHKQDSYSCDECDYATKFLSRFVTHRCEHMGVKLLHCPARGCGYVACTRSQLKIHSRKHTADKIYSCSICSFTSKWPSVVKIHQLRHCDVRKHQCKLCNYTCYRKDQLKSHTANRHSSARPFSCHMCGYSCKHQRTLLRHKIKHQRDRPHTCSTCGKSFKSSPVLRFHERSHLTSFAHHCTFCKFRCSEVDSYKRHVQRHMADFSQKPYKCSQCPYAATKRKTLATHKRRKHKDLENQIEQRTCADNEVVPPPSTERLTNVSSDASVCDKSMTSDILSAAMTTLLPEFEHSPSLMTITQTLTGQVVPDGPSSAGISFIPGNSVVLPGNALLFNSMHGWGLSTGCEFRTTTTSGAPPNDTSFSGAYYNS